MQLQRPSPPPSVESARPASAVCTQRLGLMEQVVDRLVVEIDLEDFAGAERVARHLQDELHPTVVDLSREGSCGQLLVRSALEGLAGKLENAANRQGIARSRHSTGRHCRMRPNCAPRSSVCAWWRETDRAGWLLPPPSLTRAAVAPKGAMLPFRVAPMPKSKSCWPMRCALRC